MAIVGAREVAGRLARVPHPYGRDDAHSFLDKIVPAEWVWAVTLPDSDTLRGVVGLTPGGEGTAELGYWLAPSLWGRGITTEAANAVLSFGFDQLGLSRFTSGHAEDNPASGKVLRKLGFVETGRAMSPCLATGVEMPTIRMALPAPHRSAKPGGVG